MRRNGVVIRGLAAGVVAATTVIVWFLVLDLVQGEPLRTPVFLASLVLGIPSARVGFGQVALYTLMHYAVFALLGVIVALLIRRVPIRAPFLIGLVIGFLLFDAMFYASVAISGINVVERLGWPGVLGGNLFAGIMLMFTLRLTGVAPGVDIGQVLRRHEVIREGLIAGLLGAGAVALWFLLFDLAVRRPFFTPAALGSALFYGAPGPAAIEISVATVLGYTFVHVAAFLIAGVIAAAFFVAAERHPPMILAFILVLATFAAHIFAFTILFATWILDVLGWWAIVLGTLIGLAAIIGYLWRTHPAVVARIRGERTLEAPS